MRLNLVILAIALATPHGLAFAGPSGPQKRLEATKRARARAMEEAEEHLLERLQKQAQTRARTDDHAALVHFYLWKLKRLVPPSQWGLGVVSAQQHAQLKGRSAQIREAMDALFTAMVRTPKAPSGAIDAQDRSAAHKLGIGRELGAWPFLSAWEVQRAQAHLDCMGETPFWGAVERFDFRPTAAQLDAKVASRALEGYGRALRAAQKAGAPAPLVDRIADQYGLCLSLLGRSKEAIKLWQVYLQNNGRKMSPSAFESFTQRIENHLGTSANAKAYREALGACSPTLYGHLVTETDRVVRAFGISGLDETVDEIQRRCRSSAHGLGVRIVAYTHAARSALWLGRCDAVRRYASKIRGLGPSYAAAAQAAEGPCRNVRSF